MDKNNIDRCKKICANTAIYRFIPSLDPLLKVFFLNSRKKVFFLYGYFVDNELYICKSALANQPVSNQTPDHTQENKTQEIAAGLWILTILAVTWVPDPTKSFTLSTEDKVGRSGELQNQARKVSSENPNFKLDFHLRIRFDSFEYRAWLWQGNWPRIYLFIN